MAGNSSRKKRRGRRVYTEELKNEAVQMVLDGHRAESVAENLGLSSVSLLYRWKAKLLRQSGPAAATLESRVRELEEDLRRVERERDVLKKALAIFSQRM
jgi:transposase